jgi:galactose mutarotase-like enzyme
MINIENDILKIAISTKGAELQSITNSKTQLEYLWGGDPAFWGKKSPVLFPIVGTLKNDTYYFQGKAFHLGRHGFARDMEFVLESQAADETSLLLCSNEQTMINYPFEFEFRVHYKLNGNSLRVFYDVKNISSEPLFFSVGGHPAFKLPLVEGTNYDDYFLEFNENETSPRWPISKDGLIETVPEPLLVDTTILPLSKSLFSKDALVFKHPSSSMVSIKSEKTEHGLDFDFSGFPYLGLWAAKNADFVCIEPWCGIADSVNSNQQLTEKEGINKLAGGKDWQRSWTVSFY